MAKTFNISTIAFATQEDALLTIANNSTNTHDIIQIHSIEVKPIYASSTTTAAAPGAFGMFRCSTFNADSLEGITILAQNPANTIQSQIVAYKLAEITSAKSLLRKLMVIPIGNANFGLRAVGTINPVIESTATVYKCKYASDVENFVINEGESFAIAPFDATQIYNSSFYMYVKIRTSDNKTYTISDVFTPINKKSGGANDASFLLHNGTGSGINIQIIEIQIHDLGPVTISSTTADSPEIRFTMTAHATGGEIVTPSFHNTTNTLPSYFQVKRNTFQNKLSVSFDKNAIDLYIDLTYPSLNHLFVRKFGTYRRMIPTISNLAGVGVNIGPNSNALTSKDMTSGINFQKAPIIVNVSQTFAVLCNNNTLFSKYYVEAEISYITANSEIFSSNAS